MRLVKTLLILLLLVGGVGAVIFYNREITEFSEQFLTVQDGDKALLRNDWDGAMAIYEDAYHKDNRNMKAALKLAKIYHRQAEFYEDEGFIEYYSADDPPQIRRKSVGHMKREAERLFKLAIQADPKALEPRIAYARYLQELPHRLDEAVKIYQGIWKQEPREAKFLSGAGDLYKAAAENPRETRQAVKDWLYDWSVYYYRQALVINPELFQPRFNLGVIYHLQPTRTEAEKEDNLVKAIRQYCNALIISPDSYETRYNLGLALVDLKALNSGFRQLSLSVNILAEQDRVLEAQQLAQQIQSVRNSIFYDERQYQLTPEDMEPWLRSCLGEEIPEDSKK